MEQRHLARMRPAFPPDFFLKMPAFIKLMLAKRLSFGFVSKITCRALAFVQAVQLRTLTGNAVPQAKQPASEAIGPRTRFGYPPCFLR